MVREKNIEVPNTDQDNKDDQQLFSIAYHQHHSLDFDPVSSNPNIEDEVTSDHYKHGFNSFCSHI